VSVLHRGFLVLEKWLNGLSAAVLTGMMLLVAANVFGRYLFNYPILGTLELTEFCMVAAVYMALSFTQLEKAHINIDLMTMLLSSRKALACNLMTYLMGFIFFALIVWQGSRMTLESYAMKEVTFGTIEMLEWPVKLFVPFGSLVICIRFLLDAVQTGRQLLTGEGC
jgi:TRAP-type C4-dicarboxylate transport system permease small subunit